MRLDEYLYFILFFLVMLSCFFSLVIPPDQLLPPALLQLNGLWKFWKTLCFINQSICIFTAFSFGVAELFLQYTKLDWEDRSIIKAKPVLLELFILIRPWEITFLVVQAFLWFLILLLVISILHLLKLLLLLIHSLFLSFC